MSKYKFERYEDPFRAFNIQMSIICDLEQGGKIDENEAFEQVKALYKQFKHYFKHEHEAASVLKNKEEYENNKYMYKDENEQ
jgi:Lon protease-like protein